MDFIPRAVKVQSIPPPAASKRGSVSEENRGGALRSKAAKTLQWATAGTCGVSRGAAVFMNEFFHLDTLKSSSSFGPPHGPLPWLPSSL